MKLNYRMLFIVLLTIFSLTATLPLLIQINFAKISDVTITTSKGDIGAYLVSPYTSINRNYVFVIIHGFSASRIFMRPLAVEISRLGFVSVVIDLPGHFTADFPLDIDWNSRDVADALCNGLVSTVPDVMESVFEFAKQAVNNASAKIILVGHSLGGALSIIWGSNSEDVEMVFAIAPLPPYRYVNETNPKKLIVFLGSLDEVFTVEDELKLLEKAGWENPKVNSEYQNGSIIRAFYMIPNADHITEPHTDFFIEKMAEYLGRITGREYDVSIVFSPVEMFIGNVVALIIGFALLILFPYTINPIFGYNLRKDIDKTILDPKPKMSAKRDTVFALFYGGFAYIVLVTTWGVNLTPTIPLSFIRFTFFILTMLFIAFYFSIHEFLFKRFFPKFLNKRVQHVFFTASGLSIIIRFGVLVIMFLGLYALAVLLNMTSSVIILRLSLLVMILLIPVVLIMELLASMTAYITERFSSIVVANLLPWAFILSAFFPIMTLPF